MIRCLDNSKTFEKEDIPMKIVKGNKNVTKFLELVILRFSNYVPDKGVFHDRIKNTFLSRSKRLRKL